MNKKEVFSIIKTKTSLKKEEVEKIYNEQLEIFKTEYNLEGAALEEHACNATLAKVKKHLMSKAEKFTGLIIGKSDITDFGSTKRHEKAVELWKKDPEKAIREKWTDSKGIPLTTDGKRNLVVETSRTRFVYLLAKKDEETAYNFCALRLRHDSLEMNTKFGFCEEVEFRANVSDKSNAEIKYLNQAAVTEFKSTGNTLSTSKIINDNFKSRLVKLDKIKDWHKANENNQNRIIFINGTVSDISELSKGSSNLVKLNSKEVSFGDLPDENELITCWVSRDIELNFIPYSDIYIFGKTSKKPDTEEVTIQAFGIVVPEESMVKKVAVKSEDIVENKEELENSILDEEEEEW